MSNHLKTENLSTTVLEELTITGLVRLWPYLFLDHSMIQSENGMVILTRTSSKTFAYFSLQIEGEVAKSSIKIYLPHVNTHYFNTVPLVSESH